MKIIYANNENTNDLETMENHEQSTKFCALLICGRGECSKFLSISLRMLIVVCETKMVNFCDSKKWFGEEEDDIVEIVVDGTWWHL